MVSELINRLKEQEKQREASAKYRPCEMNRTYYLCMEDRKLSVFTQLWMQRYKPCQFSMRDASANVRNCIVVSIEDKDGRMLDFITEALAVTEARLAVSKIKQNNPVARNGK